MLRVMIVDDEPIIRRGIESVPDWAGMCCEVVAVAENGIDAMEKAKIMQPDIVITDIMMPEMNGLELSEALVELYPTIKIILLTGYKEFEYAKKAIQLNVVDYLLKPIDPDDLCAVVKKAVCEINKKLVAEEEVDRMRQIVTQSRPLLREKFLADLLFSRLYSANEIQRKLEYFCIDIQCFVLLCIDLDASLGIKCLFSEEDYTILLYLVNEQLTDLFEKNNMNTITLINGRCIYAIVNCDVPRGDNVPKGDNVLKGDIIPPGNIVKLSELLSCEIEQKNRFTVSIYVSDLHRGASEIITARMETDRCRTEKFFVGDNCVICFNDIAQQEPLQDNIDVKCFVKAAAMGGDIHKETEKFIAQIRLSKDISNIKNAAVEAIVAAMRSFNGDHSALEKRIALEKRMGFAESPVYSIMQAQTTDEITEILKRVAQLFDEEQNKQRNSRHNSAVDKAISYITDHISESITLEEIALVAYMSPCYFSKIFKKIKGSNLSDYLIDLRISKACELLRSRPDMKNYEIAEEVGIQNVRYFCQLFKKVTQMTPGEYRGKSHAS